MTSVVVATASVDVDSVTGGGAGVDGGKGGSAGEGGTGADADVNAATSARVFGPTLPTASSELAFCRSITAVLVRGPKYPVAETLRKPSEIKNSWRAVTSAPREPIVSGREIVRA